MPLKKKLKSKSKEDETLEKEEKDKDEQYDKSSRSEDENDDEDNEDEEGEEEDNEVGGEMIIIDFEAREPIGSDLESIKAMLKQKYANNVAVNVDELSRIIVEQGARFGNVVFQIVDDEEKESIVAASSSSNDESEIYGFLSGVDLNSPQTKHFSDNFIKSLSKIDQIAHIFATKKVFYIINERFVNMPVKICIPMFQDLLKSLRAEKMDFDYWLFVAKVFHQRGSDDEKTYVNPEEEVFEEFSDFKFEISDTKKNVSTSAGNNTYRISLNIFLVSTFKIDEALNKIIDLSQ